MKNLNTKPFIYTLAALSVIVLFIAALIQRSDLRSFLDVLKLIPTVATVDGIAYLVFTTWLWRWKLLQGWLVPFPDLQGTWQGFIRTQWQDADGNTPDPIPAILSIKQNFGRMSCVLRTSEMESHSYLEGFCIDGDAQLRQFCYSYTSRPKAALRDRSTPHDGTILFNIIGQPIHRLEGEYWTQRQTTGTASLTFRTKKLIDELPGDLVAHPAAESQVQTEEG